MSSVMYDSNERNGDLLVAGAVVASPIAFSFAGAAGTRVFTVPSGLGLVAGMQVKIVQSRGTNAGQKEYQVVESYVGTTLTFQNPLDYTYADSVNDQAQVVEVFQFRNMLINVGATWSPPAWNQDTGGELCYVWSGECINNGVIDASGLGFVGAPGRNNADKNGLTGEESIGPGGTSTATANGSGGGGGQPNNAAGGGGGHIAGATKGDDGGGTGGQAGSTSGSASLTTSMTFGGGGGSGANNSAGGLSGYGGAGGACIDFKGNSLSGTGFFKSNGINGTVSTGTDGSPGGGGGGAGGSIRGDVVSLSGSLTFQALKGTGAPGAGKAGGDGADGRVALNYCEISVSITSSPAATTVEGGHDFCMAFGSIY